MRQPDRIIRLNTVLDRTGPVPVDSLSQDRRGHVPRPDQDQRKRRGMAGIRHQPMGRQPRSMAARKRARPRWRLIAARCPAPGASGHPRRRSNLRRCWAIRGRSPAGRPSTTSPHGPSPTTGPIPFRSRRPRSRCSSNGSATCSTSYSAPAADAPGVEIDVEIRPPIDYM